MRGRSLLCCKQITQDVGEMHVYEYTNKNGWQRQRLRSAANSY